MAIYEEGGEIIRGSWGFITQINAAIELKTESLAWL